MIGNISFLVLLLSSLATAPAAPVITQVGNAYAYRSPTSIHSGIARGGLIGIIGQELGPGEEVHASNDASFELAGFSVSLSAADRSYSLPVMSTRSTRLVAFIPVQVPAGEAKVVVHHGDAQSAPVSVKIVEATFGIATLPDTGYGPAFASNVTDDTATMNTLLNPARPGQAVILYGTGLGVSPLRPTVWVGNYQARVDDAGPTGCCKGVDEIHIVIPEGIEGCYVPVAVQIGNTVSNFASLAVSSMDGPCSDPTALSRDELERIRYLDKVRVGAIAVIRDPSDLDWITAKFEEYDRDVFLRSVSIFGNPPFGTCTVNARDSISFIDQTDPYSVNELGLSEPPGSGGRFLDAGNQLDAVNTASFSTAVPVISTTMKRGFADYSGVFRDPVFPRQVAPLRFGTVQVTGTGGRHVGAFQATQIFGSGLIVDPDASTPGRKWLPGEPSPEFLWHPAPPGKYAVFKYYGSGQTFLCTVAPGVGSFRVPAFVTLAFAEAAADGSPYVNIVTESWGLEYLPVRFSAPGIDIGVFYSRNER